MLQISEISELRHTVIAPNRYTLRKTNFCSYTFEKKKKQNEEFYTNSTVLIMSIHKIFKGNKLRNN